MKRLSLIKGTGLALTVLALFALAGCSAAGSDDQSATSLTALHYYTTKDNAVAIALDECAAENDVTITQQDAAGAYIPKVLQAASSRTLPDILMLDNKNVQQIAEIGALAPLNDYGITTDGFTQAAVDAGTYDGQLYGIGPAFNTLALFYNKDQFAEAGVEPPTTWDELKTVAAKLTTGDRYGIAFDGSPDLGEWQFLPFMWSNGGDEENIATPATAEALQLWTDLVNAGSASSGVLTWGQQAVTDQFVAGKAAMAVGGSWEIPRLEEEGLNYGVLKIPVQSPSDTAAPPLGGETWSVTQSGDKAKQEKAAAVISCLLSEKNQLAISEFYGYIPVEDTVGAKFSADHPEYAVFAELMQTVRARTAKLGSEWPEAETKIATAIQSALSGKASPSEALEEAQNDG